jgi:hypothetical protein
VEGSDGVYIVEPIPLHSAGNDELFVFRRAVLIFFYCAASFRIRLLCACYCLIRLQPTPFLMWLDWYFA